LDGLGFGDTMTRSLFVFILLAGCTAPGVFPTADGLQQTPVGRIDGTVIVDGPARGRVILFLFDASSPPPPVGSGRPRSFAAVSSDALFAEAPAGSTGRFTAPFVFSLVPPGEYLVQGFLDVDGDFVPWFSVTAEPTGGDVGSSPVAVSLTGSSPVARIAVSVDASKTVPVDRPAFRVVGSSTFNPEQGSKALDLLPEVISQTPVTQQPQFLIRSADDDGNGVPDDADADGVVDVYPKIRVRKLADRTPVFWDEHDLNRDGKTEPEGSPVVILPAKLDPSTVLPLLSQPQPVPVSSLRILIEPRALDVQDPANPVELPQLPSGRYAITVIQFTGQTWRVPNELQPSMAVGLGFEPLASQQFFLEVP